MDAVTLAKYFNESLKTRDTQMREIPFTNAANFFTPSRKFTNFRGGKQCFI